MNGFVIFLIVLGGILAALIIGFLLIKSYLNNKTKQYLGMGIGETAKLLSDGLKEECTLPYAVAKLAPLYKPQIDRDFPEIGFDRIEAMARNAMIQILAAIEGEKPESVNNSSMRLQDQIRGIVESNQAKEQKVHYDKIKIHAVGVDSYNASKTAASAVFQVSLQSNCYTVKKDKVISGSKDKPTQNLFSVTLAHNQDLSKTDMSSYIEANCPNCGAPIPANSRQCSFCGTGVALVVDRYWQIDSFKLLK